MTEQQMNEKPDRIDGLTKEMNRRFGDVDQRFEQIDQRFNQIDQRFEQIDQRFDRIDQRFEQMDQRFAKVDSRLDKIEVRLEQRDELLKLALEQIQIGQRVTNAKLAGISRSLTQRLTPVRSAVRDHEKRLKKLEARP